jgi:hypothetical protein
LVRLMYMKPSYERNSMGKFSVDRKKLIVALTAAERGAENLDRLLCGIDSCILKEEQGIVRRIENAYKVCIDTLKTLINRSSSGPPE